MITLILNGGLFLIVIVYSLKHKEYRYTLAAGLSLVYFGAAALDVPGLIEHSQVFGLIQKLALVVLAVYMIISAIQSPVKKTDVPVAVCTCVACLFRFARTLVVNFYTGRMEEPAADAYVLLQDLNVYYTLIDSVTKFSLILMLFLMCLHLGKPKAINS